MKISIKNKNAAIVELNYDEIYVLLQCAAEIRERMSDEDIQTVMGTNKEFIREIAKSLNDAKNAMDT